MACAAAQRLLGMVLRLNCSRSAWATPGAIASHWSA